MTQILLVEDDLAIREALKMSLEGEGPEHRVTTASNGDEALARWRTSPPDVILLDIMLPGIDGLEVCRTIRKTDQVPIIMLTAKTDPVDVIVGLEAGADDYVTKPFDTKILIARIRAVLRRTSVDFSDKVIRLGDLTIDPSSMTVSRDGEPIDLSATEFRLLSELAARPGQVFTREILLERVWQYDYLGDSRLVDVCVQRVRAKVEQDPKRPQLIQTVRGAGYKSATS
ncbi:MAG: response regulator transcription factor [Actinomycetota bacterium]